MIGLIIAFFTGRTLLIWKMHRMLLRTVAVFLLLSQLSGGATAQANGLHGYWRMDSPMDGMQAIVELYDCGDEAMMCGKIAAVVGEKINRQEVLYRQLLHGLRRQPDGSYKGKLKMPAGRLPVMNALVEPASQDNLTIRACFFGQCRSGTLSRLN